MKTNAPEKIYLLKSQNRMLDGWYNELPSPKTFEQVEYTRTDAFIEKACEFLKSYRQDTPDRTGYIAGVVNDKTIEDFRKYIKGE